MSCSAQHEQRFLSKDAVLPKGLPLKTAFPLSFPAHLTPSQGLPSTSGGFQGLSYRQNIYNNGISTTFDNINFTGTSRQIDKRNYPCWWIAILAIAGKKLGKIQASTGFVSVPPRYSLGASTNWATTQRVRHSLLHLSNPPLLPWHRYNFNTEQLIEKLPISAEKKISLTTFLLKFRDENLQLHTWAMTGFSKVTDSPSRELMARILSYSFSWNVTVFTLSNTPSRWAWMVWESLACPKISSRAGSDTKKKRGNTSRFFSR